MTLSGYTGSTIQWQTSPNGTTGWTNVSGGTGATTDDYTTASLANGTYYYRAVVTDGGACTDESDAIEVVVAANPVYCSGAGIGNATFNNHIEGIGFHEWTDPTVGGTNGYVTNNYLDYTDTTTYGYATVVAGQYHHLNSVFRARGSGSVSTTFAYWIDWNGDGVFTNTLFPASGGERMENANFMSTVGNSYAGYFTVPATSNGMIRVRMRTVTGNVGTLDPCTAYSGSQTKDFMVKVLPSIGNQVCNGVNGNGNNVLTNTTVDKVNISSVEVDGPSGNILDVDGAFFGIQSGGTIIMYNYSNMMGSFSNGLTFEAGQNYTVRVEHSGYTTAAGLFIDWDGNGTFTGTDEVIDVISDPAANPFVFNFTVPSAIVDGEQVAMRVRLQYEGSPGDAAAMTGCNNISGGLNIYSEVEDYRATLSVPVLACQQVASPAIAIGNPANGTNHHLNLTWDAVTGATEYDVEVSTTGSFTGTPTTTVATNSYDFDAGDNPNTEYYFQVRASDGTTDCAWTNFGSLYTAADNPALPTVNNATGTTLDVTLVNETPVNNPVITTYSIREDNSGLFVQANGSLGATEVFQTKAAWGTVTVTGLSSNTEYCFLATAQNNDGDTRGGAGATLLTTQPFDASSALNTTGGSGPTNVFWSPSSCTTGGLEWDASNGCTGGSVGFEGAFNNFYGCFLRTPSVDATGLDEVVLTFDVSHSFDAAKLNNRMRIYYFADGGFDNTITSLRINGVDELAAVPSGLGFIYDEARTCAQVEVVFDITGVTDKSDILFYLEPSSGYNDNHVFFTWLDNVSFAEQAPTACATTLTTPQPDLIVESITPDVLSLCGSGTVDYDVQITNDGTQAIASGTNFTVSAHVGSLACGGGAAATQTVTSGLGIGASTTLTFSLTLSANSDVSFNVDNGTAIAELDEANNCGSDNSVVVGSGLGGTYTIDATQATAGTNFNSFADAASALNAQGVCSAVVFNVRTDTYDESFTLTDVAGVSAVNTITYQSQSGNPADAVIASTAFSDVVVLDNADYVTFKDITISYAGGSAYIPLEIQDDADNVTVTNCVFTTTSTSTSTVSNALIYVSESSTALLIDNLVVENSTFNGGARGIGFNSSSTESVGISITGNTFVGQRTDGIYVDDATAVVVRGNTITSTASSGTNFIGLQVDNSSGGVTIAQNTITGINVKKGIRLSGSDATGGSPNRIYNNFVALGGTYNQVRGIELSSSDHTDVLFNSVNIFTSSNTLGTTGLYLTSTFVDGSVDVLNNIFAMSSGLNAHVAVYLASTANRIDFGVTDYNNYYVPSPASTGYSSGYQSLAQWQTLLSDDANSVSIDPQFVSSTDLHINAAALGGAGTTIAGITTDIDSDVRATPPAIGADEVTSCIAGLWTGAVNTSWSTAANWDCNAVPDVNTDVTIPTSPVGGNFPEVDVTNAVAASLDVEASASLTIATAQALSVDGNVTNNGTVTVRNGGNFIQTPNGVAAHAGSGTFVVQRQGNSSGGFNAWSTPVVGGSLPGSNGYSYNSSLGTNSNADDNNPNPDPGWQAHSGVMTSGRGYFSSNSGSVVFNGVANNGSFSSSVSNSPEPLTSTDAPTFFNLIGNPYPSSISANQFINDNQGLIDGTIYFWSDENVGPNGFSQDDYATYNLAGTVPISTTNSGQSGGGGLTPAASIPSCQGFFVNSTSNGTVDFNNGQRGGLNGQFFLVATPSVQRLWLGIRDNDHFDQVLVVFQNNATDQKDWGYDSYKFGGSHSVRLSAEQDAEHYSIATFSPVPSSEKVIPLFTEVETNAVYTVSADSMTGFDGIGVYLQDLQTGQLYELIQGMEYDFMINSITDLNRFQLWFTPSMVTGLIQEAESVGRIYTSSLGINVELNNGVNTIGEINVLDMSGRVVASDIINVSGGIGVFKQKDLAKGIYAVRFQSSDKELKLIQKIILN